MYFDFEDYHPDINPVGRALTRLEVVLLSIIFHMAMVIFLLVAPKYFPNLFVPSKQAVPVALEQIPPDRTQFVFVSPRVERPVQKPPPQALPSDLNREARSPERARKPTNPLPFNRGNSPERVDQPAERPQVARGQGPQPEASQIARNNQPDQAQPDSSMPRVSESTGSLQVPIRPSQPANTGRSTSAGGSLGDSLRNLQRFVQNEQFDNAGGGGGQFGPEIQFDTKGVEFGPWIRRFIAQVKRNWFIPYAAMNMRGHVVITFNVHKDGAITDLAVVGPCPIDAFNNAAFGALSGSNPTQPLPPEYPADKAFFTVTFYYNEQPPR